MGTIPQEHYHAKPGGLADWFEKRLPIIGFARDFMAFPTPKNLNWAWIFGVALVVMLVNQIATGVILAMHYTPHVDKAFASIEHIMRDVNGGWMLRYAHANGASFFFIAVYAHMFRGIYYGSYKAPRELVWIIGVVIYLIMMATAFMGYVLPWGQMSFWGATVITNIVGAIPVVGDYARTLLWGGFSVDNPTLNRFFALHYLLPFILVGLIVLHVWAFHHVGNGNPTGVEVRKDNLETVKKDTVPFHPYYTVKDLFAVMVFLTIFAAFVFFAPNYLGHPDNYVEANPLVTPAHIVPEWYFLPFYAILRAIPSQVGGVLAMFGAIAVLAFIPWLDTSRVRSTRYRPIYRWFFWILAFDFFLLMWCGGKPAEQPYVLISQLATAYWFLHFLVVMPVVGMLEKARPLPESIEADFAAKHPPQPKVEAAAAPAQSPSHSH